jgi:hypothetical protein
MVDPRRTAPNPEFVQLYRLGTPTSKIATASGVAETTVRYHLQIAAKQDPLIRDEHKAALSPAAPRKSAAGLRNLADVLAFHEAQSRLPVSHGRTKRERALGTWLASPPRGPSPPSTGMRWRSSRVGTLPLPVKRRTLNAGSSGSKSCSESGPPTGNGPGTKRPTTRTNAPWGSGCTNKGSTTALAG